MGTPNDVVPIPGVPPPNREGVVVVPPVDGGGFEVPPKMLPGFARNGEGLEVGGFPPKLNGLVPGAGPVEVVPPPNRFPPAVVVVAVVVAGVVEVVPKSEPAGLLPKILDVVVFVPVPVVPVPGVVLCVVPV